MSNPRDNYAIIEVKSEQTVGHLLRKISCLCSLFLGKGSSITATATGRRRRSVNLPPRDIYIIRIFCVYKFLRIGEQTAKIAKICLSRNKYSYDIQIHTCMSIFSMSSLYLLCCNWYLIFFASVIGTCNCFSIKII